MACRNYVWPTRLDDFLTSGGFFRLQFDGTAQERLPLDAVIAYLQAPLARWHSYASQDVSHCFTSLKLYERFITKLKDGAM